MKIQLPDPSDMTVEQWFAQMRNVLKATENIYHEMMSDLTEEDTLRASDSPHAVRVPFLL
jgi:hypothetical protein